MVVAPVKSLQTKLEGNSDVRSNRYNRYQLPSDLRQIFNNPECLKEFELVFKSSETDAGTEAISFRR